MAPSRRYRICETQEPVLTVDVDADLNQEVVYLLIANKLQGYEYGKSRIVYIGRTERGVKRISESAADKIAQALDNDFLKLRAYVVWCNPEEDEKASLPNLLERTLIIRFEQLFGSLPLLNKRGFKLGDEGKYFTRAAIDKIIDRHSSSRRRLPNEIEHSE